MLARRRRTVDEQWLFLLLVRTLFFVVDWTVHSEDDNCVVQLVLGETKKTDLLLHPSLPPSPCPLGLLQNQLCKRHCKWKPMVPCTVGSKGDPGSCRGWREGKGGEGEGGEKRPL